MEDVTSGWRLWQEWKGAPDPFPSPLPSLVSTSLLSSLWLTPALEDSGNQSPSD